MSAVGSQTGVAATISPDELRRLILEQQDLVIIDVRNSQIFEKQGWRTVPTAVTIPLEELKDRLGELSKDKLIVTVCMGGVRAAMARSILKENGYDRVELARFDEYGAKGHPVASAARP